LPGGGGGGGGRPPPSAVFVGSIGGDVPGEARSFRPIHDFEGKSVAALASDLREWYPADERLTDFNPFFERVAALITRQNLGLRPIEIVILSDGVPDVAAPPGDTAGPYARLSVDALEYLSRNVTIRLLYPAPSVAVRWERELPRRWSQWRGNAQGNRGRRWLGPRRNSRSQGT
jgi:hypothetical protein